MVGNRVPIIVICLTVATSTVLLVFNLYYEDPLGKFKELSNINPGKSLTILHEIEKGGGFHTDYSYFIIFGLPEKDFIRLLSIKPDWAYTEWEKGKIVFWEFNDFNASGVHYQYLTGDNINGVEKTLGVDLKNRTVYFEYVTF